MSGFSSAAAAKEYGDGYLHSKVYGAPAPTSGWGDLDPGVDGPTVPSPPPDDPDENDVEAYMLARHRRTLWEIKTAWEAGNP